LKEPPSEANNYGFSKRFGLAGIDFPIFSAQTVPETSFTCSGKVNGGYYADPETKCQLYHICSGGKNFSQLCPNGTIWDQEDFTCANWKKVDCTEEGLSLSSNHVDDFGAEQEFITLDLDVSNPLENLPWQNRD